MKRAGVKSFSFFAVQAELGAVLAASLAPLISTPIIERFLVDGMYLGVTPGSVVDVCSQYLQVLAGGGLEEPGLVGELGHTGYDEDQGQ